MNTVLKLAFGFVFAIRALQAQESCKLLVTQLGNESWELRERASKELGKVACFDMYRFLENERKITGDAEIKMRVNFLLSDYSNKLMSCYKIDLRGYPDYPWIDRLPWNYKGDGQWKGWSRYNLLYHYLEIARYSGVKIDDAPNWQNQREATRLWIEERRCEMFRRAVRCKTERESLKVARADIEKIQKDIDLLIFEEDKHWTDRGLKNPALKNTKR